MNNPVLYLVHFVDYYTECMKMHDRNITKVTNM